MQNDNKKIEDTDYDEKNENDDLIKQSMINWTPGDDRPMISQSFSRNGITKTEYPRPKQSQPIVKPLAHNRGVNDPNSNR